MSNGAEKLYTLAEARIELDRLECVAHGHDWEHLTDWSGTVVAFACGRCNERKKVQP